MGKQKVKKASDDWAGLKYLLIGVIKIFEWIIIVLINFGKEIKKMIKWAIIRNSQVVTTDGKVFNPISEKSFGRTKIPDKNICETAKFEELKIIKGIKGDYRNFSDKILDDSMIVLIFGKRGSGKSSLGFKLLENIHVKTKRKCFVMGVSKNIPSWIGSVKTIENAPENGVVLIDEGAVSFAARDSMSGKNKELTKIMAVARHNNLSLIFITQNTGFIDKNVLALTDTLMIKEGSLLQIEMERPEVRKFYEKSEEHLKDITGNRKKFVYIMDSDFEGVISYNLPSFWSEGLSKNKTK